MERYITADMARKMAFEKVNTTYDECFIDFIEYIFEKVEEEAKNGKLDISLSFESVVDRYFRGIKSNDLYYTLQEVLKEKLSNYGFKVEFIRYNISPDTTMRINW